MLASAAGFGLVVDLRPASRRLYGRQGHNGRHAANMAPDREVARIAIKLSPAQLERISAGLNRDSPEDLDRRMWWH